MLVVSVFDFLKNSGKVTNVNSGVERSLLEDVGPRVLHILATVRSATIEAHHPALGDGDGGLDLNSL